MQVAASALPREEDIQTKIRKIRAFGHNARTVCAVLIGCVVIVIALVLFVVPRSSLASPSGITGGAHEVLISPHSALRLKVWLLIVVAVMAGIWLATLLQLYRLFGSLAGGAIYTAENVRRVRRLGLLWLLWAVLTIVVPLTRAFFPIDFDGPVTLNGLVSVNLHRVPLSLGQVFTSFAMAGLVLLISWIMDVGLYEKQHADALRRDADLVI